MANGTGVCFGVCGLFPSPAAVDYWATGSRLLTESLTVREGRNGLCVINVWWKKMLAGVFF